MAQYVTPTKGTGAVDTGSQGSTYLIPEIWAKEILENRTNNLVMWGLVDSHYSGEISQAGDTLHINAISEITDNTATNSPVSGITIDDLDVTQTDLLIDRYKRKVLGIHDVLKAQSKYELRAPFTERLGRFLAKCLDDELHVKAVAGFAHTVTTTGTGSALAYADIVEAHRRLDSANVPTSNRYLVVNGTGVADLRLIPEFHEYQQVGDSGIVKGNGYIGTIFNTPIYVSNAVVQGSGQNNFLLFHKSALIGATQNVPSFESDRDKVDGVDFIAGAQLWGTKVLRADHGVKITRPVTSV